MADIFISYASEDRRYVTTLANALIESGWSVWWDRSIIIGEAFDQAIERELNAATCVVVLWSSASVDSEWVKNEAAAAVERGVFLPVTIENVKIPLEFRRRQTADLSNWRGNPENDGFQALCQGIASEIGAVPTRQIPSGKGWSIRSRWQLVLAMSALVVVCIGIYFLLPWRNTHVSTMGISESNTTSVPGADAEAPRVPVEIADLAVGNYHGDVVADSKDSSLSDVAVVITKLDRRTIRITSDYERLGIVDITVTRSKIDERDWIMSASGDSTLIIELNLVPVAISYNPHGELAYTGSKLQ